MDIYKCDRCGKPFEEKSYVGSYVLLRDGVGSFFNLEHSLDLCPKCYLPILKEVFGDFEGHLKRDC